MDNQQLLEERLVLFHDAREFRRVKRVPIKYTAFTLKICDTGYKLSKSLADYDILKNIMGKYHEKYHFDCYHA